jgi:hypothetical protein
MSPITARVEAAFKRLESKLGIDREGRSVWVWPVASAVPMTLSEPPAYWSPSAARPAAYRLGVSTLINVRSGKKTVTPERLAITSRQRFTASGSCRAATPRNRTCSTTPPMAQSSAKSCSATPNTTCRERSASVYRPRGLPTLRSMAGPRYLAAM